MRKLAVFVLSAILITASFQSASAVPRITRLEETEALPPVINVQWHHHDDGYHGFHEHYHHHGSNWALALGGVAMGVMIGGALSQPYNGSYYDPYHGVPPYGFAYDDRPYYRPYAYYRPYRYSHYHGSGSHVRWCRARYRSYRAYDDTYQPNFGPRHRCVGPY